MTQQFGNSGRRTRVNALQLSSCQIMSVCRPPPEQNVSHAMLFTDTDKRLLLRAT